jgi:small subunit ribosomal protein S4
MKKGLQGIDAQGGAAYKPAIRGSDGPEIIGVGGPRKGMPVGRKPEDNALRRAEARKWEPVFGSAESRNRRRRSAVTKRTSAKHKIDRRMGENIWGRAKSPLNRREYGPGQHGQRRKNKLSDFGTQLRAKQKLKGYYGDLTEKQFRKIFTEAERVKGDTGANLVGLLERRLDAVIYRAKFVPTIFAARQFVNHGHVQVNGKRVNIASYRVKEGDVIALREKSRQLAIVLEAVQLVERDVPDYLEVDHSKMTATFVRQPGLGDVPYPVMMEPNLVVEFYAKN